MEEGQGFMALEEYVRKRKFEKTPEPPPQTQAGRTAAGAAPRFYVQRHDATRLHYDFRLEIGGVLVSWAVPKGPSLEPLSKFLAAKVEDHPLEYGEFEGNIPAGNYGAGSVMLWDRGTWELLGDAPVAEQLARGDLKFRLHGAKLKGEFAIVHMKNRGKGNEWLLIKKRDADAVPGWDIEQFAWSVLSGRTQQEIAQGLPARKTKQASAGDPQREWKSRPARHASTPAAKAAPPAGGDGARLPRPKAKAGEPRRSTARMEKPARAPRFHARCQGRAARQNQTRRQPRIAERRREGSHAHCHHADESGAGRDSAARRRVALRGQVGRRAGDMLHRTGIRTAGLPHRALLRKAVSRAQRDPALSRRQPGHPGWRDRGARRERRGALRADSAAHRAVRCQCRVAHGALAPGGVLCFRSALSERLRPPPGCADRTQAVAGIHPHPHRRAALFRAFSGRGRCHAASRARNRRSE